MAQKPGEFRHRNFRKGARTAQQIIKRTRSYPTALGNDGKYLMNERRGDLRYLACRLDKLFQQEPDDGNGPDRVRPQPVEDSRLIVDMGLAHIDP